VEWIAEKLGLEPVNVLELVTFYPMLRQHPAGKIQFKVCRTLSCALAGSHELYGYLQRRLRTGTPDDHGVAVTEDGRYSVEFVECLAACGGAPVVMVNEDHYENVTTKRAEELIEQYSVQR
jgi:NADH-quinone oxidoreductase subunit E